MKAEAQRHYDEARNLSAVGLLAAAHRAGETAAVFGLDTDEFIEWRLDTAKRLIAWQVKRFGGFTELYGFRLKGWNEAWIEQRMDGADWLRPVEWCELGVESVRLWQRLLLSALRSDDATRAASFLREKKSPVWEALLVHESLDLAATTLDHGDMHRRIRETIRETFEQALKTADARPAQAPNASKIAVEFARLSSQLYRDKASLIAGFTPLLNRDFAAENTAARVAIRRSVLAMDSYRGRAYDVPSCLLALREAATSGSSVDAEIMRAAFECLVPKDPKQRSALAD